MSSGHVVNLIKHFTIVIYDSRFAWLENCPYYDYRVVIYARKNVYKIVHWSPDITSLANSPNKKNIFDEFILSLKFTLSAAFGVGLPEYVEGKLADHFTTLPFFHRVYSV